MTGTGPTQDELRRRGLELQAALPAPRWGGGWVSRRKRRSEGAEVAEGTLDGALDLGLWGVLLAVPGVIIWLLRRARRKAG